MTEVKFVLTDNALAEFRELQAILGYTNLTETILYLSNLGRAMVQLTAQGCDIMVLHERTGMWGRVEEPTLENIKSILKETD